MMAVETKNDLESFHTFIADQLASGRASVTPEEALAMWRKRRESIAAVQEGLDAVAAGRTKPLDQFAEDFQRRHGISREE